MTLAACAESEPLQISTKLPVTQLHIYVISNSNNSKRYMGQSRNPKQRFRQHMSKPNSRMRQDVHAAQPNPADTFHLQVLASTTSKSFADSLEAKYIAEYNTVGPGGYNLLRLSGRSSSQFRYLHDKGII